MLLFLDGAAHYDTSRIAMKYSSLDPTGCTWAVTAEGRFGNCIKRASTNGVFVAGSLSVSPLMTRLGVWTPTTSGVCGCAVKVDDLSRLNPSDVAGQNSALIEVAEGSSANHLGLQVNPDGTITLIRGGALFAGGGGIIILAQSTEGLASGTWMFVEFKWVLHATAGSAEVRVNGVPVINYTGNTLAERTVSLGIWNTVHLARLGSTNVSPLLTLRLCDVYLADLTAPLTDDVHDFLGDGTIQTIMPNGAGSSTGWTPSAGANWDATNDRPAPDDDATYVATAVVNALDSYTFEDIPPGAIVKGAQVNILARKETEGSSALAPVVHQGSTDYVGPTQGVASLAYDRYITQPYDLNPATTAKFTAGEINAGEFGVQKVI